MYIQYLDYVNKDKVINKYPVNRYFLPLIFDGKFGFDTSYPLPENPYEKKEIILPEPENKPLVEYAISAPDLKEKSYRYFLRNHINLVKYRYKDFEDEVEKVESIKSNLFQTLFSIEHDDEDLDKNEIDMSAKYVPKRKYWKKHGSSLLQISQNYISDNWASGGVGSFSLLSIQNYTANYEKGKIKFNNSFEWKLSFYKNKNDSIFRVGEDLFRTYSDFGVKAFHNKWYYSSNMEMRTQLFAHSSGSPKVYQSAFFAPFQVNVGVGMKYEMKKTSKKNKYKTVNFNVDISPLSLQSKWLFNDDINPERHGIDKGKHHKIDVGSTLNSKLTVNFSREISFSSRFKYFSNYEKVLIESENELKMTVNQYFTTRIYLYGRFDDGDNIKKDKKLGYFQFNELLSFGFNFTW